MGLGGYGQYVVYIQRGYVMRQLISLDFDDIPYILLCICVCSQRPEKCYRRTLDPTRIEWGNEIVSGVIR